jgi:hypothetical protein
MTDAFAHRRQDIDERINRTAALIEAAKQRCGEGAMVELLDLELRIHELCELVKAAPLRDVEGVGERIVALRNDLQTLGDELAACYQALVGRFEAARRQPAIKAYGKATGDG